MSTRLVTWGLAASALAVCLTASPLCAQSRSDASWRSASRPAVHVAAVFSSATRGYDADFAGVSAQWSRTAPGVEPGWLLVGVQASGLTGPRSLNCRLPSSGAGRCEPAAPSAMVVLAPLAGARLTLGAVRLRALAGPRVAFGDAKPFAGTQAGVDAAIGGGRVALVVPLTMSWMSSAEQRLHHRTIGAGLQLRY